MALRKKLERVLTDRLGRPVVSFWMKTLRLRVEGERAYHYFRRTKTPVILLIWHGRIFGAPYFFRRRGIMPLVSPSQDGELIVRLIDDWGYKIIRGSGSHVMKRAWVVMKKELLAGGEVLIVPDGPLGPDRELKLGCIKLAAETGAVLVPWTIGSRRPKVLRSWDRFEIPRPFSRAVALFGEPIRIARGLPPELQEEARRRVQSIMIELDRRADAAAR
jgi:hypothetical protein